MKNSEKAITLKQLQKRTLPPPPLSRIQLEINSGQFLANSQNRLLKRYESVNPMDMDNHFGNTKILTLPKNPPPPPPSQYFKSVQSKNSTINSAENSKENSTENLNKNSNENSTKISSKYLPMNSIKHSIKNSTETANKNSNENSTKISSKYLPMNSINKRAATPTNILTENSTQNSAKNSSMNSIENSKQEDMIYHGEVINDRYKIDKQIGSGIYGQVFKAFDQKEQIDVAIKIIRKGTVYILGH